MREMPHPGALAHHFPEVSTEGAQSAPGKWMVNQALICALLDTPVERVEPQRLWACPQSSSLNF